MKLLIVALAVVASACAYSVEDIPAHVKAKLDKYIALKKQWEDKWSHMTEAERKHYEDVLVERLENLPEIEKMRLHDRLESLPLDHRMKLREYLRRRFPKEEKEEEQTFETDVDEIEHIMEKLPKALSEKVKESVIVQFQEATAYDADEEYDPELEFGDIPELVEIPEAVGYSESLPEEIREKLDDFLMKRENWRRKWEHLSAEKREVLEAYINGKF